MTISTRTLRRARVWMALLVILGGCSLEEAVVDGFYGGISDTVAGVVSAALSGPLDSGG